MSTHWNDLLAAHNAMRASGRPGVPEHKPQAAILACSDARVPPSVIFDQEAGGLFVVRVAGNIATPEVIASFDYAVAELGVELVVVLGHTNCGAVAAACSDSTEVHLKPLTATIRKVLAGGSCPGAEQLAERNVLAAMTELRQSGSPVGAAIRSGAVTLEGALYDLAADAVRPLSQPTAQNSAVASKELARP